MNILLVDDHSIIRQSLVFILQSQFPAASCTEARDGDTCIELMKKEPFDLVIMDMNLPDTDGITLTEWILSRFPQQRVLFFSTSPAEVYARKLYQMGIRGYLNKQATTDEISKALETIMVQDGQYMDESFKETLAEEFLQNKPSANPLEKLTKRELSIAQSLAKGRTPEEIAEKLNIEPSTIRTYKARIFQKLEVSTMHEFISKANQYKLI